MEQKYLLRKDGTFLEAEIRGPIKRGSMKKVLSVPFFDNVSLFLVATSKEIDPESLVYLGTDPIFHKSSRDFCKFETILKEVSGKNSKIDYFLISNVLRWSKFTECHGSDYYTFFNVSFYKNKNS